MKLALKKLTNGVFNGATDFLLWQIGLFGASFGKSPTSRGAHQMFNEASDFLQEMNHETVRRAWQRLKRRGLIETVKEEGFYKPIVTMLGKKRLNSIIPQYQKHRPWDKKIYIITYDVPEKKFRERNLLRETIRRLGGTMIQKSVWVCLYNIKGVLDELIKEMGIEGTVIVSNTGTDGAVGDKSIEELIVEVYELETLNEKYKEFLSSVEKKGNAKEELATFYLSILRDDPQLPFELLPYWWVGDEACETYEQLLNI